ncbi:asparagine--tRNA ligase [candidate division WOR-3 bacterium]|nr:asparagine--tRNA ligase [candidate division WOR-3 bacterium]TET78411.1 MAG: asparagine--tRNA ligase [Candidatus Cloacimonadota bacterium]
MDSFYIKDASKYVGKEVTVKGWLYNKRSSGKVNFLLIRDGTGIIQSVAVRSEIPDEEFKLFDKITQESSIIVSGVIGEDSRAPGGYELSLKHIEIVQISEPYPISPKEHGVSFLMNKRHLWLRSKKQHAILRIRAEVINAVRDFFNNEGFILVDTPILTPCACEGTTTLFETEYFGEKAYLTQTGQLYNEATCMAFGKVYCFGPTFRAEKSKTRRHITEFWQVEPEIAYAELKDIMDYAEKVIVYIVERVLEKRKDDLITIERNIKPLENIKSPFPKITYSEAVKLINEKGSYFEWGDDFGAPQETLISDSFDKPIHISHFPTKVKPFYMKRAPEDEKLALGVDVLAPEGYGEIVGGGQREENLEILEKRLKEDNLPRKAFEWYLDLRRYGSVPHAGFGLGIERVTTWICGIHHIRESIAFPRLLDSIYP